MLPNVDEIFLKSVYLPYYTDKVEPIEEECCKLSLKIHNGKGVLYKLFHKNKDERKLKELEKLYSHRLEVLSQLSNRYYLT